MKGVIVAMTQKSCSLCGQLPLGLQMLQASPAYVCLEPCEDLASGTALFSLQGGCEGAAGNLGELRILSEHSGLGAWRQPCFLLNSRQVWYWPRVGFGWLSSCLQLFMLLFVFFLRVHLLIRVP